MDMNDLVIISVDDHVSEPPDMFDKHLSGAGLASAPKFKVTSQGTNFWEYQGTKLPSIGLGSVVGRPREEYGMEPTALAQLRKGCYDSYARVDDMNVNGIAASLCFGGFAGFDGNLFHRVPDKDMSLVHLRAYNDWHVDEWCGPHPGRFIPCGLLPTWNMDETVAEIDRLARKGCTSVTLSDNPTKLGLPSIHNAYWEPMWKAITDADITICLHIGTGNPAPHASLETPIEAWIATMPMAIAVGAADWLQLDALLRYPDLKIALSEGSIGWVPYFLERMDFSHERHKAWTHSRFKDRLPSDVFKQHFLNCFIEDKFGLKNIDEIGEDMIAYECDYPHSDCLWPEVPERLWGTVKHLTPEQIEKVTHGNAMRFFNFDPFQHHRREDLTVGGLRAKAAAAKVDVTPISSGGAAPLKTGEEPRPVTSGDIMEMFQQAAEMA
ncbi:Predicted metal-dependent hydrolase, TIM-barrel fold [Sphingomonas sp. YR710]|uniref:amidohydrolase family protein n=1 Tax=Sphingomonas sp. YR710 TaxID=1882773 RepID=UPI000891E60E|nr:amidohydrolase family protein [Sphingomonas sp. YR710]SDD62457.1 Predicted metal-dependent hydrolase, TIM-barrel fold [Sphingomonas sp. YR710]